MGRSLTLKMFVSGEKVYVRIEGGTKLGGRVREGQWLGIDNESKGAHIYWLESKSVTVERNIYYNNTSVGRNDEDSEWIGLTRNPAPIVQPAPVVQPPVNHDESAEESEVESMTKRIRKLSHKVTELLDGN